MSVILHTIDCPACLVLEKKLTKAGISFERRDARTDNPHNFQHFPQLEVDGKFMGTKEASDWIAAGGKT